jgi:carboxypeptidase PM20D1
MIRRLLLWIMAALVLLAAVLLVNTLRKGSRQLDVQPIPELAFDKAAAAERLAEAVRARTVSSLTDPTLNVDQFQQLHAMLQARYPKAHTVLKREVVNELSLLYTWQGSDASLRPILLMAHQDVVPVSPGTESQWSVDAFSGTVKDGFVWGRGAWDNKGNLIAQLEAVELLAGAGFKPQRSIYLVSGADEEVGGHRGAQRIAEMLKERGVRLEFVIDEGMVIADGMIPGLRPPAAIVGVAEKGYVSALLKVTAAPGHSSMPPLAGTSAIAMMSAALQRIDAQPMPAQIGGVAREMFTTLAPEMNGFLRVAFSNLWLFGPVVQKQLEAGAGTNALLRTTTALTMAHAGNKENVLPGVAEATVNFRLLPGDTIAAVLERMRGQVAAVIGSGQFELVASPGASEATPISPSGSESFKLLNRTIREVFPGVVVTPGLYLAGSDSVHFLGLSDNVFRFSPVRVTSQDVGRLHGTNERISVDNLAELIRFYHRLLTTGAQSS